MVLWGKTWTVKLDRFAQIQESLPLHPLAVWPWGYCIISVPVSWAVS
jgi:hypothetical protein